MKFTVYLFVVLVVFCSTSLALAHDNVVVIPLNSAKKLQNVVTVSTSGGDFSNPVAAVASISDASYSNPYLVLIGPGEYTLTETLIMKPHVSVTGSGIYATIVKGNISTGDISTSALISGADFATLSDMTIENHGGGGFSVALVNSGSTIVHNIIAFASGGATENFGILNDSSSPVILDVSVKATGGTRSYGIFNYNANPTMHHVSTTGASATNDNHGMSNEGTSSFTMTNMTIRGSGGTASYGIEHSSAEVITKNCTIKGDTFGIRITAGTLRAIRSSVIGGRDISGGTLSCVNSDNETATPLNATCGP